MPDLLTALDAVKRQFRQFLLVGQRWDLQIQEPISFGDRWQDELEEDLRRGGTLHPPAGSDYFVFEEANLRTCLILRSGALAGTIG